MKLNQPKSFEGTVNIDGVQYKPDAKGVVDIPDDKVHDGLYGWGFTAVTTESTQKPVKVSE